MKRILAAAFGLFEVLVPDRIVAPAERLAFDNPEAARRRPWTLPLVRLEGATVLWLLARRDASLSDLSVALGVFGFATAFSPRTTVDVLLEVAYENPGELEVKPWVVAATRLVGVLYVVLGVATARADTPRDKEPGAK